MDFFKFNALITTYETILSEIELLSQIEWRACVIDEAHRLKNRGCKLLEGLKCLDLVNTLLCACTKVCVDIVIIEKKNCPARYL